MIQQCQSNWTTSPFKAHCFALGLRKQSIYGVEVFHSLSMSEICSCIDLQGIGRRLERTEVHGVVITLIQTMSVIVWKITDIKKVKNGNGTAIFRKSLISAKFLPIPKSRPNFEIYTYFRSSKIILSNFGS